MNEKELTLNTRVVHKPTGTEGRITGLSTTLYGLSVCIEYVDGAGRIAEHWSKAEELEPAAVSAAN